MTDAANNTTQYSYDTENNLLSITDALGRVTSFTYDAFGRVTQTSFPSSYTESYTYDEIGNLLTKTDRKGQTINYVYDALNRLTHKGYPDSTGVDYIYDLVGKIQQVNDPTGTYTFAYDNMGRLIGTTTQYSFLPSRTFTNGYTYDAASNRTGYTDPEQGTVSYGYDSLNRLTSLNSSLAGNFGFSYDDLSRRTSLTRPNGVVSNYSYDNLSRLLSVLHQASGTTTIDGAGYTYDNAGNRTSKTNYLNSTVENYAYDAIYQLQQVTQGTNTTENYTYDKVGNRLTSLGVASYSYNSSNQLASADGTSFTYDHNGNTTSKTDANGQTTYAWDFENRLASVTVPQTGGGSNIVTFKYDPFGRRIQKSSASGTMTFVFDGANGVEELNGSGAVSARYVQGAGIDEPLAQSGASLSYYDADGLGSITSLTDSTGTPAATFVYGAFGVLSSSSGAVANSYRYTGREYDQETGLYYYRARYYNPAYGRWLGEDPIGFLGDTNYYRYVHGNPANFVDPTGLYTEVILWNPVGHGESSMGHVSVVINGVSYSWGPGPGGAIANKCCKAGQMDVETPATVFISKNTKFRNGLGYVLDLTPAQETALAEYLTNFKGNYNLFWRNCGNPIVNGLASLGIQLVFDVDPFTGLPPLTITPDDLDFAFGHTKGLVKAWVPHPKEGN